MHTLDYRVLFEQSPARLLVLAPQPDRFTILSGSDRYLDATLTTREIVSRPLFEVFPDNPADPSADGTSNLRTSLVRALASRGTDRMAVQKYDIRDRSGRFVERYWAPVNGTVVSAEGEVVALVHRVEDVTAFVTEGESLRDDLAHLRYEILARGRELALANTQLRDTIEQRRKIFAIVGHDLRSPLSSISVSVGVLRRAFADLGALPPRVLDVLESSSARMRDLLNDLDDYTATQMGGVLQIQREHVDLRVLCEGVVHDAQLAHPAHVVELAAGERISAYVDPRRTQQLLTNLINNAVTYGAVDRPVRVSAKRVTGACILTVANEGEPIPENQIPLLFEPFRRGPGAGSPQQRGHMGLGLFIVEQIAQAHEASVQVESTPEATHFSVVIPTRQ
jgi:signal transduction histidine kinase